MEVATMILESGGDVNIRDKF
ncbi:hypothetical protein [Bacillus pseudomycoides]